REVVLRQPRISDQILGRCGPKNQ
ncbi:uncharacterized protein METZ01_LOCUS251620, partial [marine metagenome]